MAFGITPEGFKAKRIEDIIAEINEILRATFGAGVDLDPESPFGQLNAIFAERESLLWELSEQLYNSQYPATAEGITLDNVASITGITRRQATKSTVILKAFGNEATIIPQGSIVSVINNPDNRFITDEQGTILAGINAIQSYSFATQATEGNYTLVFDSEVTAAIAYNAVAGDVESALEALANITDVIVTGDQVAGFTIEFTGLDGEKVQPLLAIGTNSMAAKESVSITTRADVSGDLDRRYFVLGDNSGTIGVWYQVESASAAPPGALGQDRQILIDSVLRNETADGVASKTASALLADGAWDNFSTLANLITFDVLNAAAITDPEDGIAGSETGFTLAVTNQGADVGGVAISIVENQSGELPNVEINASAEEAGAIAAPAGSLTVIETPVAGWDSVVNEADATVGNDTETDTELKIRREEEIAVAGRATPDAVRARVLEVEGVTAAVMFENDSDVTDLSGIPPHAFRMTVQGGVDQDIWDALFDSKAAGIRTDGSQVGTVVDSQGFNQTVRFERPTEVDIWVEIDLEVDVNLWPDDGVEESEAAVLAYGNALNIGEDVIVYPDLICSLDAVPGITNVIPRVGTSASPTEDDNIAIAPTEIAKFDSSRITVTVIGGLLGVRGNVGRVYTT